MNQNVIEIARELAKTISVSEEYQNMRACEDAAARDAEVAAAFGRYAEARQKIEDLSMRQNPDFNEMGALTREMETIQAEIQALPLAKSMQSARKAFTELMAAVNDELSKVLNPNYGKGTPEGCTGNCASCGGSCHEQE